MAQRVDSPALETGPRELGRGGRRRTYRGKCTLGRSTAVSQQRVLLRASRRAQHSQYSAADDVTSATGLSGKLFWLPPVGWGTLVGRKDVLGIVRSLGVDVCAGDGGLEELGGGPRCQHSAQMQNVAFSTRANLSMPPTHAFRRPWRRSAFLTNTTGVLEISAPPNSAAAGQSGGE